MQDKIQYDYTELGNIIKKLNEIAATLGETSASLRSLPLTQENGGEEKIYGCSVSGLSGFADIRNISSNTVRDTINSYATALNKYSSHASKLSAQVRKARTVFEDCEGQMTSSFVQAGSKTEVTIKETWQKHEYTIRTENNRGGYTEESAKIEVKAGNFKHDFLDGIDKGDGKIWKQWGKKGGGESGRSVDNLGMALGAEVSSSITKAWREASGETQLTEHTTASGSAHISKGEAHAKAQAGLYTYSVDENGKTHYTLSPGIGAEIGASYSGIGADGSIETDFGFVKNKIEGSIEAFQAEVGGKVGLGIVDGKLNASAGVSAEANLFKATASDKVTIGPVGVEGEAGLTVGIGGHAKVGLDDGVFTFDVGAAIGIGFETSVKVDFNGVIDYAEKGYNMAKNAYKSVSNTVQNVSKTIGECSQGVSKAVKQFTKLFS